MKPASCYRVCEGREIHFTEWGAGHAGTVIAWHGLARTGRDKGLKVMPMRAPCTWRAAASPGGGST